MRVAILNREPSVYPGGDLIAIQELQRALYRQDVKSEYIFGNWKPKDLRDFDLVHVFHCNFTWSQINFDGVIASGKPFVVTPVFYPTQELGLDYVRIREYLLKARAVLPFSHTEAEELTNAVGRDMRVRAIPNGTGKQFRGEKRSHSRVLVVGARSGDKQNSAVLTACRVMGIPCYEAVNEPYELMPIIYRSYGVFVNFSGSERMSLTIGEALCSMCRVIATTANRGNEWYPGIVTVSPNDFDGLPKKIYDACHSDDWDYRPNEEAQSLTWDWTAQRTIDEYAEALNHHAV